MREHSMPRPIPFLCVAIAIFFATPRIAAAQDFYFGVQGGLTLAHDGEFNRTGVNLSFDRGYAYGATLGYHAGGSLRAEAEVTYRGNQIDTFGGVPAPGKISSTAVMANIYYDFKPGGSWSPYLGGGVGPIRVNLEGPVNDKDWTVGYQLIGGVGFSLSRHTVLAVDYRYLYVSDPEFDAGGGTFTQEYSTSTLMLGVRADF